ncbi:cobalt transporter CbiM [Bryobacterales bacterium F-183]|nr:cobalt transporter CbiM [Bryobacterales bacterium F-183]
MHIADGILPAVWCGVAQAAAWAGVYACGRKVEPQEIVRMGLLASATFAVSLIHFPLGGTSVHLGLYGLSGILLGVRAFPVIFAALLFQTLLFQHGGLLSLGVNALNMGTGALLAGMLWRAPLGPEPLKAFLAGFVGILIPAVFLAAEFAAAGYGKGFFFIGSVYLGAAALEGVLTMAAVSFLQRVKPAVFA